MKNYHELIPGKVYMGAAGDMQDAVDQDRVEVIVDLRAEATKCAAKGDGVQWIQVPLGDNSPTTEAPLFKEAIEAVVGAMHAGKRVAFHCGQGRGRTGTVAAGVLLELGEAKSVDEAETLSQAVRPQLQMQSVQREALRSLYR